QKALPLLPSSPLLSPPLLFSPLLFSPLRSPITASEMTCHATPHLSFSTVSLYISFSTVSLHLSEEGREVLLCAGQPEPLPRINHDCCRGARKCSCRQQHHPSHSPRAHTPPHTHR